MGAGLIQELAEARPARTLTLTGIAVFLSFWLGYCLLYALSYPIGAAFDRGLLSMAFGGMWSTCNLILSLIGLVAILLYARRYSRNDVLVSLALGALVWLSLQSRTWLAGIEPSIPYVYPTFAGLETFLMTLGAIGLLKDRPVLHLRLIEKGLPAAALSLALGAVFGLPFAALNVLLAVGSGFVASEHPDIVTGFAVAVEPGLMEEVAFRLMFLALALVILGRYLPRKAAAGGAILMAVVFHAALHVPGMILSDPGSALFSILMLSIVFGLPMALLAYKRDLESAVGFHWFVDAIRFSIFSA